MTINLTKDQILLVHRALVNNMYDAKESAKVMQRAGNKASAERNRMLAKDYETIIKLIETEATRSGL